MDIFVGEDYIHDEGEGVIANSRDERIRRAFTQSEESYKNELVVLTPGWFVCDPIDVPSVASNQKLGLQNIDASVHRAYFQHHYQLALDLCLAYLDGVRDGKIILEGNGGSRERELLDIAIKASIRLRNIPVANELADRSVSRWTAHPALGFSAAQAYLLGSRPRDAISALLKSAHQRRGSYPYLQLLSRAFKEWDTSSPIEGGVDKDVLLSFHNLILGYSHRATNAFSRPLFPELRSTSRAQSDNKAPVIPSETLSSWAQAAGFDGEERDALVALCTSKQEDDHSILETATGGERSVRTL